MSIVIYTYNDPYRLREEPYWDEIRSCPYFCVSQILVNGLKALYRGDFRQGRVTTVQNLTAEMFADWESTGCMVRQHAEIDRLLSSARFRPGREVCGKNLVSAFRFNREDVFQSVRTMFELDMTDQDILTDRLTPEQTFLMEVYRHFRSEGARGAFFLESRFDGDRLDRILSAVMRKAAHSELHTEFIRFDRVVIHGVHQFSPLMLRAIEALAVHKKVILLFNYQSQYRSAYQTWLDIYSAFGQPIQISGGREFYPSLQNPVSYYGNLLADRLGRLTGGEEGELASSCEIVEFDNMSEFASYVADIFEEARQLDPVNPMGRMREQIYAADSSANNILRIYFPEQFGERQFLSYPLGRFFLAIANMWDAANRELLITDLTDVRECLEAGILKEGFVGQLSSIYGRMSALFEGCTSIREMLSRIGALRAARRRGDGGCMEHISYFRVPEGEVRMLEQALEDLDRLAAYFYEDFERHAHNFRSFYDRLRRYLQDEVLEDRGLSEEFADIIRRVLERLNEVEDIDASGSFECLKATMSLYLVQGRKAGNSANWIIHDFEQIEGDVIRSGERRDETVTYHFACLSDEDMNMARQPAFPWPLDESFFESARTRGDWKDRVYLCARREYRNFKRFALLYGLAFNRARFKLSYVRRVGDQEREPYFLLKLLGARTVHYEKNQTGHFMENTAGIDVRGAGAGDYGALDCYRFRLCKYRFLTESLLEGTTVYKDGFLLLKYLEVLLENRVREDLQGLPPDRADLAGCLDRRYGELEGYFPFLRDVNRMDIINGVRKRLSRDCVKGFPVLTAEERRAMKLRETFIHTQLRSGRTGDADKFSAVTPEEIRRELSEDVLEKMVYRKEVDQWCQYCANRESCAAFYAKETEME